MIKEMNQMEYKIALDKTTVKKNQVLAMHFMTAIVLIIMGFLTIITPFAYGIAIADEGIEKPIFTWINYAGIPFVLIGIAIIIISIKINKQKKNYVKNLILRLIELIIFGLILLYCLIQQWYLPATYAGIIILGIAIAYYLEKKSSQSQWIYINSDGILIKGLQSKHLEWNEIKKVIIKHNLITIDCYNNKLFQRLISSNQETVPQDDILAYSAVQIIKHKKQISLD